MGQRVFIANSDPRYQEALAKVQAKCMPGQVVHGLKIYDSEEAYQRSKLALNSQQLVTQQLQEPEEEPLEVPALNFTEDQLPGSRTIGAGNQQQQFELTPPAPMLDPEPDQGVPSYFGANVAVNEHGLIGQVVESEEPLSVPTLNFER